jgi:Concanavalin A-like lectin/glucanases superfamily
MALTCTWGGYADTDLDFTEFFNADHSVAVRFMLQYPHAYTGPVLSVKGIGTYVIGQGDSLADSPGGQVKLLMKIGTEQASYAVDLPAGTWHHLAIVRNSAVFQMYLDGQPAGSPCAAFHARASGCGVQPISVGCVTPRSGARAPKVKSRSTAGNIRTIVPSMMSFGSKAGGSNC